MAFPQSQPQPGGVAFCATPPQSRLRTVDFATRKTGNPFPVQVNLRSIYRHALLLRGRLGSTQTGAKLPKHSTSIYVNSCDISTHHGLLHRLQRHLAPACEYARQLADSFAVVTKWPLFT